MNVVSVPEAVPNGILELIFAVGMYRIPPVVSPERPGNIRYCTVRVYVKYITVRYPPVRGIVSIYRGL